MFNIKDFLQKFKNLKIDKENQKSQFLNVLKDFNINIEDVKIEGKIAKIKASSVAKNEIFIKKSKILNKLPELTDIN